MKRLLLVVLLVAVLVFPSMASAAVRVGVAMPTQSLQRWNQDGSNMKAQLEAAGYVVDLQYANNDVALQVSQLENMILNGADILVIASIDGASLGTVLATAKDEDIPVIAYDRLIMATDAVSYYATFDNYMVGTIQGEYLVDKLELATRQDPVNIEIVGGSADDNNARYFYQGAYDAIAPYLESGIVVVPSGQIAFESIATMAWSSERAQARMDNLIAANYSDGTPLHAVLCSNDSTALGVTNSLVNAGFEDMPYITGQDCDIANTKNILAGLQSMSIFKDTRTLASNVVSMVQAIVDGEEPPINDTETYDNGVKVVPTFLSAPVFADINNYYELLIESGYYTEEQLGL